MSALETPPLLRRTGLDWNQASRVKLGRNVAPHNFKQHLNASGTVKPLQDPELASKRTRNEPHTITRCYIRTK